MARIAELEPPSPGYIRVFRGQTRDYGRMVPSLLRGVKPRNDIIFRSYSHILADNLQRESPNEANADDLWLWALWVHAIGQHYGPGSTYLDVTHSLEVALWFALHHIAAIPTHHIFGQPGPIDLDNDIIMTMPWLRCRATDEPGWLYVFDVPRWLGEGLPKHGALVDLAQAPPVFASSTRIGAQVGCLLAAEESVNGGDLSAYYACDPLQLSWPMQDASSVVRASGETMFPPPSQDVWYARLLNIPLVLQLDARTGHTIVERALPLSVYLPEAADDVDDIRQRIIVVRPLRLYPSAVEEFSGRLPEVPSEWVRSARLNDATAIVLESPLIFMTPPGNHPFWNQELLMSDLSASVEAFEAPTGATCGKVSLKNVFFEFSPLEKGGWESVEESVATIEVLRAVWLVREGKRLVLHP